MLKHSRALVERRNQRHGRRRFYAPRIKWSKWLYSGGAEDEALPTPARKANREGKSDALDDDDDEAVSLDSERPLIAKHSKDDIENNDDLQTPHEGTANEHGLASNLLGFKGIAFPRKISFTLQLRGQAADVLEWIQSSEDVLYAAKLAVALFLVLWPAFVASWNTWYSLNRGCT